MSVDPKQLGEAEVVLLNGGELAVALAYAPGATPTVVASSQGPAAVELLWCAQELGLPLFDCPTLTTENLTLLQAGQEIPEVLYPPVAHCLASVQRTRPAPQPVRLLADRPGGAQRLSRRLKRRVEAILDDLEVARVRVVVGSGHDLESLRPLLTLHRHRLEAETGLLLQEIGLAQDRQLAPGAYEVSLREVPHARGEATEPGPLLRDLYRVIYRFGWRLLGYRETEALVEGLKKRHGRLYRDLFPRHFTLGGLRQILRNLLKEGLPIRDLPGILEVVHEHLPRISDPDQLTEHVRAEFSSFLCHRYGDSQGRLHVMLLDPMSERALLEGLHESSSALWLDLDLDASLRLLGAAARGLEKAQREGVPPVVLCSPRPRRFLRRLLEPSFPDLPVLSYAEVAPMTEVLTLCTLNL